MDFGWIFFQKILVTNAAREAARYSAVHLYDDGTVNAADTTAARTVALGSSSVLPDALTASLTVSDGAVTVTVTSPAAVITGLTSSFFGGSTVNLTASSTMSGLILSLLPAVIALILMFINPTYLTSFFESATGKAMSCVLYAYKGTVKLESRPNIYGAVIGSTVNSFPAGVVVNYPTDGLGIEITEDAYRLID